MAAGVKSTFTPDEVENLAILGPTYEEMGAVFGVSKSTIIRHMKQKQFREAYDRGMGKRKVGLRRKQYAVAMQGNVTMLIWLGKQELGQVDRAQHELSGPDGGPIETRQIDAPPRPETYEDWLRQSTARHRLDEVLGETTVEMGSNGNGAH